MKPQTILSICHLLAKNAQKIDGMIKGTIGDTNNLLFRTTWRDETGRLTGYQNHLISSGYLGKGGTLNKRVATANKIGAQAPAISKMVGRTVSEFGEFLYAIGFENAAKLAGHVSVVGTTESSKVQYAASPSATAIGRVTAAVARNSNVT